MVKEISPLGQQERRARRLKFIGDVSLRWLPSKNMVVHTVQGDKHLADTTEMEKNSTPAVEQCVKDTKKS